MKKQLLVTIFTIFISIIVFAQQRRVTGTVINQKTHKPLEGVSVQSQNKSAVTDANGQFSIKAANGETITLSFVGMKSANIPITNNTGNL